MPNAKTKAEQPPPSPRSLTTPAYKYQSPKMGTLVVKYDETESSTKKKLDQKIDGLQNWKM